MADSILRRVRRVVSASFGDVLDTAERLSGDGLTREAIRQIDAKIDAIARKRAKVATRKAEALARQAARRAEAAGLTGDARFAIGKDRADLAEKALARQIELEGEAREAKRAETDCVAEDARLAAEIPALEAQREALKSDLGNVGGVTDIEALRREEDVATRLAALQDNDAKGKRARTGTKR